MRRRRRSFGQDIGPRWTKQGESQYAATYTHTEPAVGLCGDVTATLQCSKRPGKPVFGRPYSCMGSMEWIDPNTGARQHRDLQRIPARTFAVAVESSILEADFQIERQRSRCYPAREQRAVQRREVWYPSKKMWLPEEAD